MSFARSYLGVLCGGQIIQRGYEHVPGDAHAIGVRRVALPMLFAWMYQIPVIRQNICVVDDVRSHPALPTGQSNEQRAGRPNRCAGVREAAETPFLSWAEGQ